MTLTDDIRAACARVAREAESVRIVEERIGAYARELPAEAPPTPDLEGADDETRAAFSLQLNAINFGVRLVSHDPQARRAVGLPHDGGRAARPRAVDGAELHDAHARRRSRRRWARTPSTS